MSIGCILLVVVIWNGAFYKDKQFINDALYTGSIETYKVGRYTFEVPVEFKKEYVVFRVVPQKTKEEQLAYSGTQDIYITEVPWKTHNHTQEFYAYMEETLQFIVRGFPNTKTKKKHVINYEAAEFFQGQSAVCLAYGHGAEISINTYIMLPQGILHLSESRFYYTTQRITDIEVGAAQLFSHYRWGKNHAAQGDVFYTAYGMLENYPSQEESVTMILKMQEALEIVFTTENELYSRGGPPYRDTRKSLSLLKDGIGSMRFREREVNYGGKKQMEFIDKRRINKEYRAYFTFTALEFLYSRPEEPQLEVIGDAPWVDRETMMPIWNAVMQSIRPIADER